MSKAPNEASAIKRTLPPTIDVLDAAAYLDVSKYTVINRIKSGDIRAYKQGKYWKMKAEWLLEYEESLIAKSSKSK